METYRIVFLISDNNKWDHLFGHLANLLKQPQKIDQIGVVITDTAILSCLKGTILQEFRDHLSQFMQANVQFWLCGNTVHKYNIDKANILSDLEIVPEGGIFKVLECETAGYRLIQE